MTKSQPHKTEAPVGSASGPSLLGTPGCVPVAPRMHTSSSHVTPELQVRVLIVPLTSLLKCLLGTANQRKRKVCVPAVTPLGTAQPPVRKLTGTLSLQVLRPQSLDSETSSWEPHVRPNRTAAVPSSDARRSEPDHSCHRPNCHWSKRPSSLAPHGSHPTQQPPTPTPLPIQDEPERPPLR